MSRKKLAGRIVLGAMLALVWVSTPHTEPMTRADPVLTINRALKSDANGLVAVSSVTATEQGYMSGVTSAVQTQLNAITAITSLPRREVLTAARTYYVRTDGSDANTCLVNTSGGACLTVQKALDLVYTVDQNGFSVSVQVGAGTYAGSIVINKAFTGAVNVLGDTTTPANVVFSTTGIAVTVDNPGVVLSLGGVRFVNNNVALFVNAAGTLRVTGKVDFGACVSYHMYSGTGGYIQITAGYTISGNVGNHWISQRGGKIAASGITITVTGTPTIGAFAVADTLSLFTVYGNTFVGSATGQRYAVTNNSIIETAGGGATYLPGNAVGSAGTGGIYN